MGVALRGKDKADKDKDKLDPPDGRVACSPVMKKVLRDKDLVSKVVMVAH